MFNAMSNAARAEQNRMHRKERADDQLELKGVMEALSQRDAEIKAFAEKASQEIKDHGRILEETKTVLEGLSASGLKFQDRLQDLEQKLARRFSANDPSDAKSLGEQFTE
ncbi:TPA: phage major capsid protein, partial [Pseudomonas aeruginosa]